MGQKYLELKMPADYSAAELQVSIGKKLRIQNFNFQIENKSLDARNKSNIHWLIRVLVSSDEIKEHIQRTEKSLNITFKKRKEKVVIVGSGPAGFFSALILQMAGFETVLIERGSEVGKRAEKISEFEKTGQFDKLNNYAFGEGGAGTFSDGKLTSRSKHISAERSFIIQEYIEAGAPEEIAYLAHPHLGTDNLKLIVKNLRNKYKRLGGTMIFNACLSDINVKNGSVISIETNSGTFEIDYLILAIGHSAFETYRMLISKGVKFRTKNFALGCRMEHPQQLINMAQWGVEQLKGVKAAEYRLTSKADGHRQVYSFCMCPGGIVVPATAYEGSNIVNGMSFYGRDAKYANAACVATLNLSQLLQKEVDAIESLDWLEHLERKFYDFTGSYKAPACHISDFIKHKQTSRITASSYPLGLAEAPLWELLPGQISEALKAGLLDFKGKIKGFESGILLGLESKTSSSIQVLREPSGLCEGFENLYMLGEGSGYAGGIISSGADGVKGAMHLINLKS